MNDKREHIICSSLIRSFVRSFILFSYYYEHTTRMRKSDEYIRNRRLPWAIHCLKRWLLWFSFSLCPSPIWVHFVFKNVLDQWDEKRCAWDEVSRHGNDFRKRKKSCTHTVTNSVYEQRNERNEMHIANMRAKIHTRIRCVLDVMRCDVMCLAIPLYYIERQEFNIGVHDTR